MLRIVGPRLQRVLKLVVLHEMDSGAQDELVDGIAFIIDERRT